MFAPAYMGREEWAEPYDRFCYRHLKVARISPARTTETYQTHGQIYPGNSVVSAELVVSGNLPALQGPHYRTTITA